MIPYRQPQITVLALLLGLTIASGWLGFKLHVNHREDKALKADYFTVNQIKYGLLSGNNWAFQFNRIIASRIDSFEITHEDRELLERQVSQILHRMLDEADATLHRERENLKDKIRFGLINAFIDVDDFREEVPRFAAAIVDEIGKSRHKEQIKELVKDKVTGILDAANQDSTGVREKILSKYGMDFLADFNNYVARQTDEIRSEQRAMGLLMTLILAMILLVWLYILRSGGGYATAFLISVLASSVALFTGVSLPMIEIDARISELSLEIMSSSIVFYDQVIFYQAKSILDVIEILITHGGADTVLVGVLILLFSVLFPITKLVCTNIFLYRKEKSNAFIRYMAFNSGKWSMADVMVIAIFMAYVGFKSILDNQLQDITVSTETINVVTTNKTNLQTGFMVFVAFTLFNLMLAVILKKITRTVSDHTGDVHPVHLRRR